MNKPADVDQYLAGIPPEARATFADLRLLVRQAAPDALETVSYGMAAFKYRGRPLIYFGAWKNHYALYGTSRGTMRFGLGEPLPETLIASLIEDRVAVIDAAAAKRRRASAQKPA